MKYLTKAGVKFIKESRTGRQHPKRGRAWRRAKFALHKARALLQGHDLPKVRVPRDMSPEEEEVAYKTFKRTAAGGQAQT